MRGIEGGRSTTSACNRRNQVERRWITPVQIFHVQDQRRLCGDRYLLLFDCYFQCDIERLALAGRDINLGIQRFRKAFRRSAHSVFARSQCAEKIDAVAVGLRSLRLTVRVRERDRGANDGRASLVGDHTAKRAPALLRKGKENRDRQDQADA